MNEYESSGPDRRCPALAPPSELKVTVPAGAWLPLPDGTEIGWSLEDNAKLFKRRLPDPPWLVITVRCPPMVIGGADLRLAREHLKVPLGRVAAVSGLSQGHLSKVERGEPGRPVTAAVLAAYRWAGVVLPGTAVGVCPVPTADRRVSSSSLLTPGGWWRTRNNDGRFGRRWPWERY